MDAPPKTRQIASSVLALVLWLITFGLGLQAISVIRGIYDLVYVILGGSIARAERFVPWLLFTLALVFLIFIIFSTEYHLKRIGKPESWRLFGWTIAVELIIIAFNFFL